MPPRKIKRGSTIAPFIELEQEVADYLSIRSLKERSDYHEAQGKAELMAILAERGELKPNGDRTLRLNEPILFNSYKKGGNLTAKEITGIKRQRRESTTLNPAMCMMLLQSKGLVERCTTTHVVVDEDAVLAAVFEGLITDEEVKTIYDTSESFAFYLVEGKEDEEDDE